MQLRLPLFFLWSDGVDLRRVLDPEQSRLRLPVVWFGGRAMWLGSD